MEAAQETAEAEAPHAAQAAQAAEGRMVRSNRSTTRIVALDAEIGGLGNKMSYRLVRLRIVDPSTLQTMALSLNDDLQLAGRNEMTRRRIYCPTSR